VTASMAQSVGALYLADDPVTSAARVARGSGADAVGA
jgi:hypothetical protein